MESLSFSNSLFNTSSSHANEDIVYNLSYLMYGPMFQLVGSIHLLPWIPHHVHTSSTRINKYRSTWLARLAAAVSGVWAVLALHQSYHLRADLMNGSSQLAVNLIMFSLGVHVAEMMDMILCGNFTLLSVHHLAVIITFAGAVITQQALGFAVLTLITELNAVTNKTRILHIITDTSKLSLEYKINSYTNVFTFFIRILIIFWMNQQSFVYFMETPCIFFGCSAAGLLFVNMWNLIVFRTIIFKDILNKPKTQ